MARNIIITGGGGGIGQAIAGAFLNQGDSVFLIGRDFAKLEKVKKEILKNNPRAFLSAVNVSDNEDVGRLGLEIEKLFNGRIDVLVNAAAIHGPIGPLEGNDPSLWLEALKVNIWGTALMCRLVIPFMKKQKFGRIINFSGGGEGALPNFTAYTASKGAVLRFTESLAAELKGSGITINAIAPGAVNTQLIDEIIAAGPEKSGAKYYQETLDRKNSGGISPEKAAGLILFLASEDSAGLTGKFLSAAHDHWAEFPKHLEEIKNSDIYNVRRIKPKDRDYEW